MDDVATGIVALGRPATRLAGSIRFPAGTPVDRLANALDAEGFAPTWHERDGAHGAERVEGSFPCRIVARVYWRIGNDDRITAVRGTYREEGCL